MTLTPVPHHCRYNHEWTVDLPYNGYYYPDPLKRFCHTCLEEGRIEVASIQIKTTSLAIRSIEYVCPQCLQRTILPLREELPFMMEMATDEEEVIRQWHTPSLRWYHLPFRWPVLCEHRPFLT